KGASHHHPFLHAAAERASGSGDADRRAGSAATPARRATEQHEERHQRQLHHHQREGPKEQEVKPFLDKIAGLAGIAKDDVPPKKHARENSRDIASDDGKDIAVAENRALRILIALIIDVSGSVIPFADEIEQGIAGYFTALAADELASLSVETALVMFSSN